VNTLGIVEFRGNSGLPIAIVPEQVSGFVVQEGGKLVNIILNNGKIIEVLATYEEAKTALRVKVLQPLPTTQEIRKS